MVTVGSQPIVTATKAEEQLGADSWTRPLALNLKCLQLYHSIMATLCPPTDVYHMYVTQIRREIELVAPVSSSFLTMEMSVVVSVHHFGPV